MQETRRLHEISMVFNRVFTRNQSDYGCRLGNSQRLASLHALSRVGLETTQVKSVENHLHPIRRVTHVRMELARCLGAANDSLGQSPREARAGPGGPHSGALVGFRMQFTVTDVPDNRSKPREPGCNSSDQVGMIHPGLDHLRLRFAQPSRKSQYVERIGTPSFHPQGARAGSAGFDLSRHGPQIGEGDHLAFEPSGVHPGNQAMQHLFSAVRSESRDDVGNANHRTCSQADVSFAYSAGVSRAPSVLDTSAAASAMFSDFMPCDWR